MFENVLDIKRGYLSKRALPLPVAFFDIALIAFATASRPSNLALPCSLIRFKGTMVMPSRCTAPSACSIRAGATLVARLRQHIMAITGHIFGNIGIHQKALAITVAKLCARL